MIMLIKPELVFFIAIAKEIKILCHKNQSVNY